MSADAETRGMGTPRERLPQEERKHPDEWERDLNPGPMAGQNIGPQSHDREAGLRTAHDTKELHRGILRDFGDDDLKRIPVLGDGMRLQQGATYVDLDDGARGEFTARGDMEAGPGHHYVPKDQVPYELWNRLIGEPKPAGRSDPDRPAYGHAD